MSDANGSDSPKRACRLTLELQADTPRDLAGALMNMAADIDRGELSVGVRGGPSSGGIYELILDEAPTHNEYFAQVRRYLAEKNGAPS